jgi:hypothetical protein
MNDLTEKEIDVTQLEITESGLFSFQGFPVTIYLKELGKRSSTLKKNISQSAKFHLTPCSTIGDPRSSKRVQRYIATTRIDGLFPVLGTTQEGELEEVEVKLQVCRACLAKLNYKDYNDCDAETQDQIAHRFNIEELLSQFQKIETANIPVEVKTVPTDAIVELAVTQSAIVETPSVESLPATSPATEIDTPVEKTATPKAEFTLLTNIFILQALLERLKKLLF